MSGRYFDLATATAAVLTVLFLTPGSGAGQAPTAPEKTWNPPRTSDRQPDIQGFWANQGRRLATYNIQAGADERHVLFSGDQTDQHSLIVDPADGKNSLSALGGCETAGGL